MKIWKRSTILQIAVLAVDDRRAKGFFETLRSQLSPSGSTKLWIIKRLITKKKLIIKNLGPFSRTINYEHLK